MILPLSDFIISAAALPEGAESVPSGFTLPGAEDLLAFSELLGGEENPDETPAESGHCAPFSLPAMLDDAICGEVTLSREIDFGALCGDRAVLTIDRLFGRGSVLIGETPAASFDSTSPSLVDGEKAYALTCAPCQLAVDLSAALCRGRREALRIRFDETRPAGVCGAIILQTTQDAFLSRPALMPDALSRTAAVRVQITALRAGSYVLRVLAAPPVPQEEPLPVREIPLTLAAQETHTADVTIGMSGSVFSAGTPYVPFSVKLQLLRMPDGAQKSRSLPLCDTATLSCGYPGKTPPAYVPLIKDDLDTPARDLVDTLAALAVPAVLLQAPAPDDVYRAMTRAGVGVIQPLPADSLLRARLQRHPCVSITEPMADAPRRSAAAAAWQLCGMTGYARTVDPDAPDSALLAEAAGRRINPEDENVQDVLAWLRAVSVRLRCEAARQRRFSGALCDPGDIRIPDVSDAVGTAFAPLHLSALPLCGAWWTGTRFSAALEAFIPADTPGGDFSALAVLEDGEGTELARCCTPLRAKGGYAGAIDAMLPEQPCVLELRTRLLRGEDVIEESVMPVYVGERGPLEAAFAP